MSANQICVKWDLGWGERQGVLITQNHQYKGYSSVLASNGIVSVPSRSLTQIEFRALVILEDHALIYGTSRSSSNRVTE